MNVSLFSTSGLCCSKWESCSFVVRAEAESQEEPKVAETEVLEETEVEAKAEGAVEIAVTIEERPTFKPRVELGDIIGVICLNTTIFFY